MSKQLKITRVRSDIGCPKNQRATLKHLGLRRTNHSVVREDSPMLRGMIRTVAHLVAVEEVTG